MRGKLRKRTLHEKKTEKGHIQKNIYSYEGIYLLLKTTSIRVAIEGKQVNLVFEIIEIYEKKAYV